MYGLCFLIDDQYYFDGKIVVVIIDNSRDRDKGKTQVSSEVFFVCLMVSGSFVILRSILTEIASEFLLVVLITK